MVIKQVSGGRLPAVKPSNAQVAGSGRHYTRRAATDGKYCPFLGEGRRTLVWAALHLSHPLSRVRCDASAKFRARRSGAPTFSACASALRRALADGRVARHMDVSRRRVGTNRFCLTAPALPTHIPFTLPAHTPFAHTPSLPLTACCLLLNLLLLEVDGRAAGRHRAGLVHSAGRRLCCDKV